jgi:hypothetical protein
MFEGSRHLDACSTPLTGVTGTYPDIYSEVHALLFRAFSSLGKRIVIFDGVQSQSPGRRMDNRASCRMRNDVRTSHRPDRIVA